jgi:D-alanyl-D-alanine endopeptidase (penicillin-binding protein 7)
MNIGEYKHGTYMNHIPNRERKLLLNKKELNALLIKSDNSAAEILAADYPGGREEFIRAMNMKAVQIGMHNTSFVDPSGLGENNRSTGKEVNLMTNLAFTQYGFIKESSAKKQVTVETKNKKKKSLITLNHTNSNLLNKFNNIVMSKTGFTNPAGRCVTFVIKENQRLYTIVILGAKSGIDRIDLAKKIIYNLQTGV